MDAVKFTELIKSPEKVHSVDVTELKRLANQYPYSQALQLLYAVRLKNSSEHLFNQQLGRTSILTSDRTVLFDLFEGTDTTQSIEPNAPVNIVSKNNNIEPVKEEKVEKQQKVVPEEQKTPPKDEKPVEPIREMEKPKKIIQPEKIKRAEEVDISSLSASDRIKAILENSRRIQKEFGEKKKPEGETNERVRAIREKLEEIKAKQAEVENKPEPVTSQKEEPKEEESLEKVAESIPVDDGISSSNKAADERLELVENIVVEAKEVKVEIEQDEEEQKPIVETQKQEEKLEEPEEAYIPTFTIDDDVKDSSEPKPIDENESHSFSGWLDRLKTDVSKVEDNEEEEPADINQKLKLFDSFVEKLPEIKKKGLESPVVKSPVVNRDLSNDGGALVTETLANVYIQQGHLDKAMKAYQILKLKYPEKSGFFADQISRIKKLKNNK